MKPRLEVQELTGEDEMIWLGVTALFEPMHDDLAEILLRAVDQDRRDAELMLQALESRTVSLVIFEADRFQHSIVWTFHAGPILTRFRPLEQWP